MPAMMAPLRRRKDRRHIITWIGLVIGPIGALGLGWLACPLVLPGVAKLWMVSDHRNHADVIVVLGGGIDFRPAAAAALYKRGVAPLVAIGHSELDHGFDESLNREKLLQHGVPASAIVSFRFRPHNTCGEAIGILEWAKASRVNGVIIPIDFFPSRRVRWIFDHELAPAGISVSVEAITPPWYNVDDWWRHQAEWQHFRSELIKFAYYRLRY
jgi:uncharacterized SAM-binding protein YcdF (DUF218 family)